MTCGFTVAADGTHLPIQVVGKGTTFRCLAKFNLGRFKDKVKGTWSNRGWTTKATMIWYIDNILLPHTKKELAVVTWDCYGSHLDSEVIAHAHKNNIHVIPVPPGGTSTGLSRMKDVFMCVCYYR